jgi:GNAT superfamily N-acetyltransferase
MAKSVTRAVSARQDPVALVSIAPVETRADRRRFVEVPYVLHAGSPHWVPPLRRDEWRRLSPRLHPFHDHASMTLWLAWRDGRAVGRVAAIDDRLHDATHGERVTWFGFFEASDADVAAGLLDAVERHARARGSLIVRGPANPSLHASAGLLIDAFADDPFVLMPYNPPAYPTFVEAAGYRKAKDLFGWSLDLRAPLPERLVRLCARVARRDDLVVRTVRMTRRGFAEDLDALKIIYRAAWAGNWGFVPPTDAELEHLAHELRPVIEPDLIVFVECAGRPVGVAVAVPDVNQVLKRMHGRLLPFGLVHLLRRRRLITRGRVLLLGVLPEHRRRGLYPLLIAELHRRGRARGYESGELSWTLEDNDAINAGIEAAGGRRHKTYRIYEKPVG